MNNRKIATYAMLVAITVVLAFTPFGMIQIPPIAITIMHIPVIIAAVIYGVEGGLLMGVVFGVLAWYTALTKAVTPFDLLFQNPLISVVPRVLFGLGVGLLAKYVMKLSSRLELRLGIIGLVGSLIHSFLVISFLYLFSLIDFTGLTFLQALKEFGVMVIGAITFNVIVEAIAAMLITIGVGKPVLKVLKIKH